MVGAGTCAITASQSGNANYAAAEPVARSFAIGQGNQSIDFPDPGPLVNGASAQLQATATSGLPVSYLSETPATCMVTPGGRLTVTSAGLCLVAADQPGNANWVAAPTVRRAFATTAEDPAIQRQLIADLQRARARNLILLQPDLLSLLDPAERPNATDIAISTSGGDFDLSRMGKSVWFRLAGSRTTADGDMTDHYAQLSFGTHLKLGPDTILGVMGTLDTIRQNQTTGSAEGEGWMAGPYLVARIDGTALTFEGRALFGRTSDRITEAGWTAQDVSGTRSLLMLKASGRIERSGVELRPYLRFSSVRQATEAYVTTSGVPVGRVASDYQQGTLGIDFSALRQLSGADMLQLRGGVGLSMTDDSLQGIGHALDLKLGLTQTFGEVWTLDADVTGSADTASDARTLGLSLKLQARF
jgi:hypothetical protein